MRVPSSSLYNLTTSRLNRIKGELLEANETITTGKKVNSLSDNPVTISPILNLKSSISNIEQFADNIATGRQWLEGGETALSNTKELITEAKTLSIAMNNGVMTDEDLVSGAESIAGIRDHILTLANTQVKGNYIFSGTKTNIMSFVPDDPENPTRITYMGSENVFAIKMAQSSDVEVGEAGNNVFQNPYVVIDETNNKIDFREDAAGGAVQYTAELTATIPTGKYTPQELGVAVEAAMETRSAAVGQPEVINITQNDATFVVNDYSALTIPTGAANIDLTYTAATNRWAVADDPGYVPPINALSLTSDDSRVDLDFTGDGVADISVEFDAPVADGYTVSFDITAGGGNAVDYSVTYNDGTKRYTISELGGPVLDNLEMMWATGSNSATTVAPDMGFDVTSNDTGLPDGSNHVSDDDVEWGIFRTLIDLEEYLRNGDSDGVNRSIARLTADFDYIGGIVSEIGIKGNRLDVRDTIISDLNISYETNKMRLEDADMIEAITLLNQKEFSYNAALNASSKIIDISLLNYV